MLGRSLYLVTNYEIGKAYFGSYASNLPMDINAGILIQTFLGPVVFGGAVGQSRIGAAACEGAARNPGAAGRIQTMMILGLALIESLVLLSVPRLKAVRRLRLS